MREIDNRSEILPHIDAFHATRDSHQRGDALRSDLGFDFQAIDRGSQRGEAIRDVKGSHQGTGNREAEVFAPRRETDSRWAIFDIDGAYICLLMQSIVQLFDPYEVIQEFERFYIITIDHSQTWITLRFF